MNKNIFFVFLLMLASSVISYASTFWWMDVNVGGRLERVYFFRDLNALEAATGFPRRDCQRENRFRWSRPLHNIPSYFNIIYATMRREGFVAAFMLSSTGTSIQGRPFWIYYLFLLWNDMEYWDMVTRHNQPVRFP